MRTQALRNSTTCWFATLPETTLSSWAAQPPVPIFTCGRCVTRWCCLRCCCCCFQLTPSVQPACFILQSRQSSHQTRGYRRLPPEVSPVPPTPYLPASFAADVLQVCGPSAEPEVLCLASVRAAVQQQDGDVLQVTNARALVRLVTFGAWHDPPPPPPPLPLQRPWRWPLV
jgi:hypothetical protein